MTSYHILLLPGDGIGPEVVGETRKIMDWFAANRGIGFTYSEAHIGGAGYDATGNPLPPETLGVAKLSLRAAQYTDRASARDFDRLANTLLVTSSEHAERMRAFAERGARRKGAA